MADQVLPMGILEMDFERILGVTFLLVVLTLSCCDTQFICLLKQKLEIKKTTPTI